jgi:predicted nucleotidyltransferase
MIMDFQKLKDKLTQLANSNDIIELLWLYGSCAKKSAHKNSDIDLAVVFKTWEEDIIERRLRPELLAIDWQRALHLPEGKLTVLDINLAPIPLAMSVINHGELLVSKSNSRQFQEMQRIMSKWEIDYLYHYQHPQSINASHG